MLQRNPSIEKLSRTNSFRAWPQLTHLFSKSVLFIPILVGSWLIIFRLMLRWRKNQFFDNLFTKHHDLGASKNTKQWIFYVRISSQLFFVSISRGNFVDSFFLHPFLFFSFLFFSFLTLIYYCLKPLCASIDQSPFWQTRFEKKKSILNIFSDSLYRHVLIIYTILFYSFPFCSIYKFWAQICNMMDFITILCLFIGFHYRLRKKESWLKRLKIIFQNREYFLFCCYS